MKKYMIMAFSLLFLFGYTTYLKNMFIFEEPCYVMIILYIGFFCANYKDLLGIQSFSLQRIGSRINAALVVQKTLFFRILVFVSVAHLICMTGYITSKRAFEGLQAAQFYFLMIINLNITCFMVYLFSMIYGKIKGSGGYMFVVFFSLISSTTYYDFIYISSAFGGSSTGVQKVVNTILSYIIVFALVIWLWKKYKKADLQI